MFNVSEFNRNGYTLVRRFHEAFGHPVGKEFHKNSPDLPLRVKLITEEYKEFVRAAKDATFDDSYDKQEALVKELADLLYVVYGFGVTYGWDLSKALELVHESNMSKLGPDGKPIYREDGKVLKGPNYKEPDLKRIVEGV